MSKKEGEKRDKAHFWSNDETNFLVLQLKERNILKFMDGRKTRNAVVFHKVSEEMRKAGFVRTSEQCRVRWKHVKQAFIKARKNKTVTDMAFPSCCDVLEDLLGDGLSQNEDPEYTIEEDVDSGGVRKRPKISKVWVHFTLRKADNVVQCIHCKMNLAYHNSTSTMHQHLKRRHPHLDATSASGVAASTSSSQQRMDSFVWTGPLCTVEDAAESPIPAVESLKEIKEEPLSLQDSEEASGSSPEPEWCRTSSPQKERTAGSPPHHSHYAEHQQSENKRRRRMRYTQDEYDPVLRYLKDMNKLWTQQLQRSEEREERMLDRIIESNATAVSQLLECIRSLQPSLAPQPTIVPGSIKTLADEC
ncbi:uncharacterized protein LOC114471808 isoform X2 [Gouania willdenowi]|uniref:uncharacterized protein LOC114471808 isoform X2 n=1 Tax=Gouania willdenowi TaxID=441366 RepID=UPI0010551FAA|nr:uncharacterized protein LOC114471808 isoform X2 [Gouania willdenowi]